MRRPGADAWAAAVETSYPTVWRFCAMLTDPAAADDLAQETFLRATRALTSFRGHADQRTWLLAIARNVCADHLRQRYRTERASLAIVPRETEIHDMSEAFAIRDLIGQLELDRRAAFTLTQLLGLTYPEAAAVCDCPVGTIRSRVARAREDLIELMGESRPARAERR